MISMEFTFFFCIIHWDFFFLVWINQSVHGKLLWLKADVNPATENNYEK